MQRHTKAGGYGENERKKYRVSCSGWLWKWVGERIVYALLQCEGQLFKHGSYRKFEKLRNLRKG
jgi:hypothetical protein